MSNIPELTVRCSFRGHCYKKSVISIDDANVVNDKLIIHCNRSNGPHPALRVYAAKSDVSSLHDDSAPFPYGTYISCFYKIKKIPANLFIKFLVFYQK